MRLECKEIGNHVIIVGKVKQSLTTSTLEK